MGKRHILDKPLSRRTFVAGAAAATTALQMPWIRRASAADFAGKKIRVLTWSDATGQAAVRNILQPFEKATGAKIIADLTGTTSDMIAKIKASAARPQYDLVILSGFGANTLAGAVLGEKLPVAGRVQVEALDGHAHLVRPDLGTAVELLGRLGQHPDRADYPVQTDR